MDIQELHSPMMHKRVLVEHGCGLQAPLAKLSGWLLHCNGDRLLFNKVAQSFSDLQLFICPSFADAFGGRGTISLALAAEATSTVQAVPQDCQSCVLEDLFSSSAAADAYAASADAERTMADVAKRHRLQEEGHKGRTNTECEPIGNGIS